MSKSKIAKILISLKFSRAKAHDLISRGHTVYTNMGAAPGLFTSPPVPLTTLKQDIDDLNESTAAAVDGVTRHDVKRHVRRSSTTYQFLRFTRSKWRMVIQASSPRPVLFRFLHVNVRSHNR